jgi:hypothetical protein
MLAHFHCCFGGLFPQAAFFCYLSNQIMTFTDRFVRFPIMVQSVTEMNLTGNAECFPSWQKINPLEISHYKPTVDKDYGEETIINVTMKTGHNFNVYLSPQQFEDKINKWGEK